MNRSYVRACTYTIACSGVYVHSVSSEYDAVTSLRRKFKQHDCDEVHALSLITTHLRFKYYWKVHPSHNVSTCSVCSREDRCASVTKLITIHPYALPQSQCSVVMLLGSTHCTVPTPPAITTKMIKKCRKKDCFHLSRK